MLPNFLIVGAAKCGTTSLYYYLNQHPEIFLPPIKETFFLTGFTFKDVNLEGGNYGIETVTSIDDYIKLFKNCSTHQAIGEICVAYLYFYKETIPRIKKYLGDPKIVIILRNPVERAFSNYLHHVRDGYEKMSFEEALDKENERSSNNWWWGYKLYDVGLYYRQVKAYIENFSSVQVYLYDDFIKMPQTVIRSILNFLEVDDSYVPDINTKYNVSLVPKIKFIHNFLTKYNFFTKTTKLFFKIFFAEETIQKFVLYVKNNNLSRPAMKPKTKAYLIDLYRDDILKLQTLFNEHLTHWFSYKNGHITHLLGDVSLNLKHSVKLYRDDIKRLEDLIDADLSSWLV